MATLGVTLCGLTVSTEAEARWHAIDATAYSKGASYPYAGFQYDNVADTVPQYELGNQTTASNRFIRCSLPTEASWACGGSGCPWTMSMGLSTSSAFSSTTPAAVYSEVVDGFGAPVSRVYHGIVSHHTQLTFTRTIT